MLYFATFQAAVHCNRLNQLRILRVTLAKRSIEKVFVASCRRYCSRSSM